MRPIAKPRGAPQRGVTLMEMLVVVVLISLMVGITVPAFQSGLPTIRLRSASSDVAQFLYSARNQVERSQLAVQVRVDPQSRTLSRRAVGPLGQSLAVEQMELPSGVEIVSIGPARFAESPGLDGKPVSRDFFFYPGAAPPAIEVALRNERGMQRWVRLDPITLAPVVLERQPAAVFAESGSASSAGQ